ncbi:hypothetical protein [Sphingopyxis alaskensis]|uniref:hypothetical protein n=1 Tax=Sphingopyxis alaskensis TaxID=117207 RepID=UPI00203B77B0|nr:hypothetical protein [Sphingopyxis alaskensis]
MAKIVRILFILSLRQQCEAPAKGLHDGQQRPEPIVPSIGAAPAEAFEKTARPGRMMVRRGGTATALVL